MFIDEAAAGAIDDADALFGAGEIVGGEDIFGLRGQGRVQGDDVGTGEQLLKLDLFNAEIERAFGREEGIEGDDAHTESLGPLRQLSCARPKSNTQQGLIHQLVPQPRQRGFQQNQ